MGKKQKRALIVATIAPFIEHFETNNIHILQSYGYDVFVATNFKEYEDRHKMLLENANVPLDHQFQVDFSRSPFTKDVLIAYKQLKQIAFKYKFTLIHCHTPVGGVLARLVAKNYNRTIDRHLKEKKSVPEKIKVIYTAHGFHFFDGAPKINWILFYPVEKYLSHFTDVLITINKEDYNRASNKFYAKKTVYVPGVGVDVKKFARVADSIDREQKRQELGVKKNDILLLSIGELNENKHHSVVIKALSLLQKNDKVNDNHIVYFIAGSGDKKDELEKLATDEGVDLRLLGYRNDVSELLAASDLYILPSIREGLNVSLMEAMASGTPCLCANIRGNVDLVESGKGGELFDPYSIVSVARSLKIELSRQSHWREEGLFNKHKIKKFDVSAIEKDYKNIIRGGYRFLAEMLNRQQLRNSLGVKNEDFLLISVGELSKRKNQIVVLKALYSIKQHSPETATRLKYIIVGQGNLDTTFKDYIESHGLKENVKLLGFRSDISDLLKCSDLFVFPSLQEGLPVALMEAISSGIEVVCSRIRGNMDLVSSGLFEADDIEGLERLITETVKHSGDRKNKNIGIMVNYSIEQVQKDMKEIYGNM